MSESEYERGLREGEITARLQDHGRRLDIVNGSIAVTGQRLAELTEAVHQLTRVAEISESRALTYVPMIQNLEQSRLLGLKRWHVAIAGLVLVVPQGLNLAFRVLGVA